MLEFIQIVLGAVLLMAFIEMIYRAVKGDWYGIYSKIPDRYKHISYQAC